MKLLSLDSVFERCVFDDHFHRAEYKWAVGQAGEKNLRCQTKMDSCGQGLISFWFKKHNVDCQQRTDIKQLLS